MDVSDILGYSYLHQVHSRWETGWTDDDIFFEGFSNPRLEELRSDTLSRDLGQFFEPLREHTRPRLPETRNFVSRTS